MIGAERALAGAGSEKLGSPHPAVRGFADGRNRPNTVWRETRVRAGAPGRSRVQQWRGVVFAIFRKIKIKIPQVASLTPVCVLRQDVQQHLHWIFNNPDAGYALKTACGCREKVLDSSFEAEENAGKTKRSPIVLISPFFLGVFVHQLRGGERNRQEVFCAVLIFYLRLK